MFDVDKQIDSDSSFTCFDLDAQLLEAVAKLGFTDPTPIQKRAIPALLSGSDVIGRARTGSGKTAAFGLPLLHNVSGIRGAGVKALVVTPTRELALQVTDALQSYSRGTNTRFVTIYGGSSYGPQLHGLRAGAPVVVGTPGRLLDHLKKGTLDLSGVEMVVLDEADEMLQMGFIEDIGTLLDATPETRQVALFSATMPAPIRRVAAKYLKDPVEVQVDGGAHAVDHIDQFGIVVPHRFKLDALERVLRSKDQGATLVFAQTRVGCAAAADALSKRGFAVDCLHGDMTQPLRERVLGKFRRRQLDVVVATDVASRGIDVEHITLVVNLDLPRTTETYVHRIGRTGRAGRAGTAISFVTHAERRQVNQLERSLQTTIQPIPVPTDADIAQRHQVKLHTDLKAALEGPSEHLGELSDFLQAGDWTAEDLALAAVRLLAAERGLKLDEQPSSEPPEWSRPPQRREPRQPGATRDNRAGAHHASNEVSLVVATGKKQGTRPGDLVGALTAETGVPGRLLGRISITDRKSFVGCSLDTAQRILSDRQSLEIRGQSVSITLSRPARTHEAERFERRAKARPQSPGAGKGAGSAPLRRVKDRKKAKRAAK